MNEFCLMMFHTPLSNTALQINSLSKLRINVDRWIKPNPEYLQTMHVVILFVIHLDLLPSSIHTQSLHSIVNYERCSPEKDRHTDTQADRHRVGREMAQQRLMCCTHTDLLFVRSLRTFHSCVYLGPCCEY